MSQAVIIDAVRTPIGRDLVAGQGEVPKRRPDSR